jgi:Leucine-rich repeat (LRR) protein
MLTHCHSEVRFGRIQKHFRSILLLTFFFSAVRSLCPSRCRCDDSSLSAECTQSGLDVLPITLNPQLSRLQLHGNHIRSIQQTLSFYTNLQLLDLSANHLQTLGQRNLAQLQRLQQLNLDQNRIHRLETHSFEGLAHVRLLTIASNQLGELPSRALSSLTQLQRLDLSRNHIVQLRPDWAYGLRSLLHLNLSSNQLPAVTFNQNWTHLSSLLELDLSHNPLHFLPSDAFASLPLLRSLHLHNCLLQQIHSNSFRSLHSLLHLVLNHNPLSSLPVEAFRPLTQLRSLRALSLKLRSLSRSDFQTLRSLNSLHLGDEPLLTQLDSELFQHNHELRVVSLENCPRLTRIPSDLFSNNSQLHELHLRNNAIRHFRPLSPYPPHLRSVWLSANPLHCDCDLFWLKQRDLIASTDPQSSSRHFESLSNREPQLKVTPPSQLTDLFTTNYLPPPTNDVSVDSLQAAIDEDDWTNQINPELNPSTNNRKSPQSSVSQSLLSSSSSSSSISSSAVHLLNPFSPSAVEMQNHIDRLLQSKHTTHSNGHGLHSKTAAIVTSSQSDPSSSSKTLAPFQGQTNCASPASLQGHALQSLALPQLHCPASSFSSTSQTKFTSIEPTESGSDLWSRLNTLPLSALLLSAIVLICAVALMSIFWRLGSETIGCCRWWMLHLFHSKRRSSSAHLHRPSVLRSTADLHHHHHQRNSIASSGGSMKPLCAPLHESKCLFDNPKNQPRYSKLRLLPLSSVPPPPLLAASQSLSNGYDPNDSYSSDTHEYEQVRFYESIGPTQTLFSPSAAARLYENPMQRYESIPRRGALRPLPASIQPYSGVQLV